jgi:hypothetical protein
MRKTPVPSVWDLEESKANHTPSSLKSVCGCQDCARRKGDIAMTKIETSKTTAAQDSEFQIAFTESKSGYVHIDIMMPSRDFDNLRRVIRRPKTMAALCGAAEATGLNKVLSGSVWCATCYPKLDQHQFEAKNGFNAFWEALWHCGLGSFQLKRGKCKV